MMIGSRTSKKMRDSVWRSTKHIHVFSPVILYMLLLRSYHNGIVWDLESNTSSLGFHELRQYKFSSMIYPDVGF